MECRKEKVLSKKQARITIFIVAAVLIAIDQFTKHLASTFLRDVGGRAMTIVPGLLEFRYLENTAAAMGLFAGIIWLVMILGVGVAAGIVVAVFLYKGHTWASYTASALLLAGGLGNLIDRLINLGANGERFVVDFIYIEFFPYVFNFADCCVTIGAVFLIIHFILCFRQEKRIKEREG